MTTESQAYEIAARQGFEGIVYHSEQDAGVGRVDSVKLEIEDPDDGSISFWAAEVSEANGCECFWAWSAETEAFYHEQMAERKAARKSACKSRKVSKMEVTR